MKIGNFNVFVHVMFTTNPNPYPHLLSPLHAIHVYVYLYYYRLTKDVDTTRPGGNAEYDRLVRPEPNY